jgi:hypothetical protein
MLAAAGRRLRRRVGLGRPLAARSPGLRPGADWWGWVCDRAAGSTGLVSRPGVDFGELWVWLDGTLTKGVAGCPAVRAPRARRLQVAFASQAAQGRSARGMCWRSRCWVGCPGGIGDDNLRDRVDRILGGPRPGWRTSGSSRWVATMGSTCSCCQPGKGGAHDKGGGGG